MTDKNTIMSRLNDLDTQERRAFLSYVNEKGPNWKASYLADVHAGKLGPTLQAMAEKRGAGWAMLLPGDLTWLEANLTVDTPHTTTAPYDELLAAARAFLDPKNNAEQALAAKERLELAVRRLDGAEV